MVLGVGDTHPNNTEPLNHPPFPAICAAHSGVACVDEAPTDSPILVKCDELIKTTTTPPLPGNRNLYSERRGGEVILSTEAAVTPRPPAVTFQGRCRMKKEAMNF